MVGPFLAPKVNDLLFVALLTGFFFLILWRALR